jgi:hypothetical protein
LRAVGLARLLCSLFVAMVGFYFKKFARDVPFLREYYNSPMYYI